MSDLRKTLQKLDEMSAGTTGGGAIAPSMGGGNGFANGGPGTKKRLEEVDLEELNVGKPSKKTEWMKTEKEKKAEKKDSPSNFAFWGNKPKPEKVKVKESKKIIDEADLEEEKLEPKDKKPKNDSIGKKKPDHRDIGQKPADKGIQPKQLKEGAKDLEYAFKKVRSITSGIKHGVDPRDIMTQVERLAEEYGVDVSSEIGDVYTAMKALESAVYALDDPFEYEAKHARWREEEEEDNKGLGESPDGNSQSTKMFMEKNKK